MSTAISKVSLNGSSLNVKWSDGEVSNFNFMWLRDNCPTARDKDSRHRMFNLLEVSTNIAPRQFKINAEGKLEIEWNEGNHTSYYDQKWLRENCYTLNNKKKYISPSLHLTFSEDPFNETLEIAVLIIVDHYSNLQIFQFNL